MVRKRAPGGGRKPIGSTAAQPLTIRIDDDLRRRLELAARQRAKRKKANWNLSQEIIHRLRCSLSKEREDRRNRAVSAICDLISDMAKRELLTDLPEQQSWHRDPFTFRAFKVAVTRLLDELEPAGEMRPPQILAGPAFFENPETLGNFAADRERIALLHGSPLRRTETARWLQVTAAGVRDSSGYVSPLTIDEFEDELHAWSGIRRALGIEEPKEQEP